MNQKTEQTEAATLGEIQERAAAFLKSRGVPEPDLDAWYLMEEVWGIDRSHYYAYRDEELEREGLRGRLEQLAGYLKRRGSREPLQHILGRAWFMELEFVVNPHVLIPRQDTEILVEEARKLLRPGWRVLDMCTGSGCILLSLLYHCKGVEGVGADISPEALVTARENSRRLGMEAEFVHSDLFTKVTGKYNMIVSNPPYIPRGQIDSLMEEVREFDPRVALDGGEDGLDFYRRLVEESPRYLMPGGALLLEIGWDQGEWVKGRMEAAGYGQVKIVKGLSGLDRAVLGYSPE